jgi:SAM-dependent methyltransferase
VSNELQSQHDLIREEFKKQASGWGKRQDDLTPIATVLGLQEAFLVLDVASGSGLLAAMAAPHVRRVISTDITPEMMAQAKSKGIRNLRFVLAAAERLPYPDQSFDRVITRYSLHHMFDPQPVVHEMYRVCQRDGQVMVIDILAPDDPTNASLYNQLERLRDPSHTTALSLQTLLNLFAESGFSQLTHSVNPNGDMDIEGWFDLTQTKPEARQQIVEMLERDLAGELKTGFNPVYRDGRLKIIHTVATIIGTK